MNVNKLCDLADCLTSREETTIGPTDSRVAAAALRIVARFGKEIAAQHALDCSLLEELDSACAGNSAG